MNHSWRHQNTKRIEWCDRCGKEQKADSQRSPLGYWVWSDKRWDEVIKEAKAKTNLCQS